MIMKIIMFKKKRKLGQDRIIIIYGDDDNGK